jgi:uncharacterized OB-fold protein
VLYTPSVSDEPARPAPLLDDHSRAFWTGGANGELLIASCAECTRLFHPPGPICPHCSGRGVEFVAVSGRGEIDAATVVQRPWIPGYHTPYVVARVRLHEQRDVVLVSNIVECDPHDARAGMAVEVVFEAREDLFVPMFRPVR